MAGWTTVACTRRSPSLCCPRRRSTQIPTAHPAHKTTHIANTATTRPTLTSQQFLSSDATHISSWPPFHPLIQQLDFIWYAPQLPEYAQHDPGVGIVSPPFVTHPSQSAVTDANSNAGTRQAPVSYTHLRAHETPEHLVCRLLLEKKKKNQPQEK
eukprot:TRINITY_DN1910_c0_g1_i2.p1 TRINITY_DN1910_c0_g1~~TRINITY_DN1910_c0_g1_i2.p1  ORF type:complete len:155 (-),score=17.45 TRINITY_DN1910_c0_g1_i2:27-491(-)